VETAYYIPAIIREKERKVVSIPTQLYPLQADGGTALNWHSFLDAHHRKKA